MTQDQIEALEAVRNKSRTGDDGLPPPEKRKALREGYGITQDQLADILNVTRTAISLWERGKRTPRSRDYAEFLHMAAQGEAEGQG